MSKVQAVLNELIKTNHKKYDMIYQEFRANHSTHLLCSLYSLGSSEEKLRTAFDNYKKKLEPLSESKLSISTDNFKEHLGRRDLYREYLDFFDNIISEKGINNTIKSYFPFIINGLSSAALHPLINIGYGLEYNNDLIVSEGLAYGYSWYAKRGEILSSIPMKKDEKINDLVSKAYKHKFELGPPTGLEEKLDNLVNMNTEPLKELMESWNINENNIEEKYMELSINIVEIFGGSYNGKTLDFFILHCLTGNHAIEYILPLLNNKEKIDLLRIHLFSTLAIYIIKGQPKIDLNKVYGVENNSELNWDNIFKHACDTEASHLVKVVRNLKNLEDKYGKNNDLYLKTAYLSAKSVKTEDDWHFRGIGFDQN